MEPIKNEMDRLTEKTEIVPYSVPDSVIEVDTEFIESDDLESIELGIKNLGKAQDVLSLAQGVGIVKIESEGYWRQGGFPNLRAYRVAQAERLNMPRSTICLRRQTAEAWLKYRKALGRVDLAGKVSSLVFFDDAVALHGLPEAVSKLEVMSYREFGAWASPGELNGPDELLEVDFSIRRGDIVVDGLTIASLSKDIPDEEKEFIAYLIRKGYSARKGNLIAHIVPVYDEGMARAIDNFAKKYMANK